MNKRLFELYLSDVVKYSLREESTQEESQYQDPYTVPDTVPQPVDPQMVPQQQSGMDPNAGMYPPQPVEVDGDDMVNVAPTDPYADPTQLVQIKISLGRIYELKKIYSKLLSISKLLDTRSDTKYEELEKEVDEALDMFHVISLNLDKFQPKIDFIIIEFYRFIQAALVELESIYNESD